ncbi:MAG: hypothetical protein KGO52_15825 [Nitrospirota bacterium]|nr:hypothetical protein [Nitrospirota bacterium]MDE3035415.1 hypothetical protein [Nitrospirota bacterium]MDE3118837.1 hypothetical protein [Nitrospirota bacterium]MDE3226750.1 hypothetical protein [Nitrospirota bacterium]MDE3244179.1 hypothetical protein [Nitrospirota bacterium]
MSETNEPAVRQAIATLSQSDPIPKLLQQVKLGKMKPTDAGLRAITEAWLGTYQKIIETGQGFDRATLRRLDPAPRLDVLIEAGVLTGDHAAVAALRKAFEQALAGAK